MNLSKSDSKDWLIASQFAVFSIGGVTTLICAKNFGPTNWGTIALFINTVSIAVTLGSFGFPTFMVINKKNLPNSDTFLIFIFAMLGVLVTSIALGSVLNINSNSMSQEYNDKFMFLVFLVVTATVNLFNELLISFFLGALNFKLVFIARTLNVLLPGFSLTIVSIKGSTVASALLIVPLSSITLTVIIVIYSTMFFSRFSLKLVMYYLKSTIRFYLNWKQVFENAYSIIKSSLSLFVVNTFFLIAIRIDFYLVSWKLSSSEFAVYSLSVLLAETIWLVANGYSNYLISKPRTHTLENKAEALGDAIKVSTKRAFILTVLVGLCISMFLVKFLGKEFAEVPKIFWIMTPGCIALVYFKLTSTYLTNLGKRKPMIIICLVMIVGKLLIILLPSNLLQISMFALLNTLIYLLGSLAAAIYLKLFINHVLKLKI